MQPKSQRSGTKTVCGFSIILILKGIMTKETMHFVEKKKKKTLIKVKRNRKWKITHIVLERRTLCFSSYKNRKLKVKLWWVGAREGIFCTVYFVQRKFFKICILSQYILYWIHFQNIHTFAYQKTLLHTLLLLVFKMLENLQCILNPQWDNWNIFTICFEELRKS